jgi:hypothetical protein
MNSKPNPNNKLNRMKWYIQIPKRLMLGLLIVVAVIILTQDIQLFPRVFDRLFVSEQRDPKTLPAGVVAYNLSTQDNNLIEAWYLPGDRRGAFYGYTAFFFYGNGDSLDRFGTQAWLASMGFNTIVHSYRGYGYSTGWPSAEAIRSDVLLVWQKMKNQYDLDHKKVVVVGHSLGTGPATWLAHKIKPKSLTLYSTYRSLDQVLQDSWFLRHLKKFLWNEFDNQTILSSDSAIADCVQMLHGRKDTIIAAHHSEDLFPMLPATVKLKRLKICEHCGHNDILGESVGDFEEFQRECLLAN